MLYAAAVFIAIFIPLEGKSLIKNRQWKELAVTTGILLIAVSYGVDFALDWNMLPNPNILITIFKPLSEAFESFFQVG